MKTKFLYLFAIVTFLSITSCNNDDDDLDEILSKSTLSNIEIGLNNNEEGIIGRDFHLNAEIVAGETIDEVIVAIVPREDGEYAGEWSFQIAWDEFKGLRNTTVHKHFDIPEDAVEGTYDFIITVTDENGSFTDEKRTIEIIDPENIAIDPGFFMDILNTNGDYFFGSDEDPDYEPITLSKNDTIQSLVQIKNVKDNGELYVVLIDKDLDYYPESTKDLDLSKVIVYDVYKHQDEEEIFNFSNQVPGNEQGQEGRNTPKLVIGAEQDNNTPEPNSITGEKAWKNGDYYYALIYTNTTHNISLHNYIDVKIEGF